MSCRRVMLTVAVLAAVLPSAWAEPPAKPAVDPAVLARIREAAMSSNWAYQRLADLTDHIGPRLSGSPQAELAVSQVATALRGVGLQVSLQAVKVPHWVRGEERAELVEYPGRSAGVTQKLALTALGGSTATPPEGLTTAVLVVHSLEDLQAHAAEAKNRIVVFEMPFDQNLAEAGLAGAAYLTAGEARFKGPAAAAKLGAAAALVRSIGGADYRLPHTGATLWDDNGPQIPAAALSAEDAMLIERLATQGAVSIHLTLTPQTLPEVDSHNVIADIPGRDKPDEIVLVSGHLDSWDLAQGALDDGAGVSAAMGAGHIIKSLGLQARRTIRVVAWMNEENGGRGHKAYFEANKDHIGNQIAAIESDLGAGRPLGVGADVPLPAMEALKPLVAALLPIGAPALVHRDDAPGADIAPLVKAGVPGFEPVLDTRSYFNYHHTAADTLDKIEPENLRRQVAVLAVLTWYLAEMPEPLPRLPVEPEQK